MITRVAIKKDGIIYIGDFGQRHHHLLCDKSRPFGFLKHGIQGFIDQYSKFYTREEAAIHAFECNQLPNHKKCPKIIFSEDLW